MPLLRHVIMIMQKKSFEYIDFCPKGKNSIIELSLMNKCTTHKSFLSHKRSYLVIKSRVFSSVRPLCFTCTICVINLFLPKNGNFGAEETPGPLITVIWNWKLYSEVVYNRQFPNYFVLRKIHFKRWEITFRYLIFQNNHQKRLRIIKVKKIAQKFMK